MEGLQPPPGSRDRRRFSNPYLRTGFQIEEPADMFDFFKSEEVDATTPSMEGKLSGLDLGRSG